MKNHSTRVMPLQMMLTNNRHQVLHWSENQSKLFDELTREISECPKLWFIDENSPIHLETDASDYGWGAYLYQLDNDGIRHPIIFISKSFSDLQKRWSTYEKEGYAIFATLRKLGYLLRDVPFVLHTDHKNLLYITESSSAKVIRWKMEIMEFDFKAVHIKGDDNIVADAFSRLCALMILLVYP